MICAKSLEIEPFSAVRYRFEARNNTTYAGKSRIAVWDSQNAKNDAKHA
jgi:hypothetical protein